MPITTLSLSLVRCVEIWVKTKCRTDTSTCIHCLWMKALASKLNYLIAAPAKDLSMMICFQPRKEKDTESSYNSVFLKSTNQIFDYKASFIDIDMKPLNKMEQYYELDQWIVSCNVHITNGGHQADNSVSIEAYRTAYSDQSNTVEDVSHARDPAAVLLDFRPISWISSWICWILCGLRKTIDQRRKLNLPTISLSQKPCLSLNRYQMMVFFYKLRHIAGDMYVDAGSGFLALVCSKRVLKWPCLEIEGKR